jgi:hypothetical protein
MWDDCAIPEKQGIERFPWHVPQDEPDEAVSGFACFHPVRKQRPDASAAREEPANRGSSAARKGSRISLNCDLSGYHGLSRKVDVASLIVIIGTRSLQTGSGGKNVLKFAGTW